MGFRIEVTADSIAELASKVTALAFQFQTTATEVVVHHSGKNEEPAPKATRKRVEKAPEPVEAEPAAVEAEPEPAAPVEDVAAAPEPATATFDYDADVKPLVLKLVGAKGRAAVEALFAEYGVANAQQIDPSLYGEFIDNVKAKLEA